MTFVVNAATSLKIMAPIPRMNMEQLLPYIGSISLKAGSQFQDTSSLTGIITSSLIECCDKTMYLES